MSPFVYFRVIRFVPRNYSSSAHHHNLFFYFPFPTPFPKKTQRWFFICLYMFTHLYVIDIALNWTSHTHTRAYIYIYLYIYHTFAHVSPKMTWPNMTQHDPSWRGISWGGPPSSPTWFFASPWPSAWYSTDPCGARWVFWEPSWARWSRHWNPGRSRPPPRRMGCWGFFFWVEEFLYIYIFFYMFL